MKTCPSWPRLRKMSRESSGSGASQFWNRCRAGTQEAEKAKGNRNLSDRMPELERPGFSQTAKGAYNVGYSHQSTIDGVSTTTRRAGGAAAFARRRHRCCCALSMRGDRRRPWLCSGQYRRAGAGEEPAARPYDRHFADESALGNEAWPGACLGAQDAFSRHFGDRHDRDGFW